MMQHRYISYFLVVPPKKEKFHLAHRFRATASIALPLPEPSDTTGIHSYELSGYIYIYLTTRIVSRSHGSQR